MTNRCSQSYECQLVEQVWFKVEFGERKFTMWSGSCWRHWPGTMEQLLRKNRSITVTLDESLIKESV